MATLRLFDPGWTLGTPGSGTDPGGQSPYSWPPELTGSEGSGIPGLHTARFAEKAGSGFFDIS